ncbi:MAG: hypothetical protein R3C69_11555 [Geminicoccaceae bacterium]
MPRSAAGAPRLPASPSAASGIERALGQTTSAATEAEAALAALTPEQPDEDGELAAGLAGLEARSVELETGLGTAATQLAEGREALVLAERALAAHDAERLKLAAEAEALAQLETPEAEAPVLDLLRVTAGCETALAAALGDDLMAGLDEAAATHWQEVPGETAAPGLPAGAVPLADRVRTGGPDASAPPSGARCRPGHGTSPAAGPGPANGWSWRMAGSGAGTASCAVPRPTTPCVAGWLSGSGVRRCRSASPGWTTTARRWPGPWRARPRRSPRRRMPRRRWRRSGASWRRRSSGRPRRETAAVARRHRQVERQRLTETQARSQAERAEHEQALAELREAGDAHALEPVDGEAVAARAVLAEAEAKVRTLAAGLGTATQAHQAAALRAGEAEAGQRVAAQDALAARLLHERRQSEAELRKSHRADAVTGLDTEAQQLRGELEGLDAEIEAGTTGLAAATAASERLAAAHAEAGAEAERLRTRRAAVDAEERSARDQRRALADELAHLLADLDRRGRISW